MFTRSNEHKIYAPSVCGAQPAGCTWRIASPPQYSASIPPRKQVAGTKWRVVGEIEVGGLSSNMNGCQMRLETRSQQPIHARKAGPYLFLETHPQHPSWLCKVSSSALQNLREFTCLGSCGLRPPVPLQDVPDLLEVPPYPPKRHETIPTHNCVLPTPKNVSSTRRWCDLGRDGGGNVPLLEFGTANPPAELISRDREYLLPNRMAPLSDTELEEHEDKVDECLQKQAQVREIIYETITKATFMRIKVQPTPQLMLQQLVYIFEGKG
ncbi:hypothetical protein B0H10DRAFT_1962092 [Mycena sp. CBHHK59/15]|nr:hypothetical protein B0H10DRAFT_1962092 [Mycena sp. CBHHK59/15]